MTKKMIAVHRPAAQLVVQRALGFHHAVNRAVHHEQRHGRHADEQRIRREQAEKCSGEFAVGVNRHAPRDVAQRDADEQAGQNAADGKADVPRLPPPAFGPFAAEFNRHRAENQRGQQQIQREVKAGEHRGIDVRKRGEQRAAAGDEPDFVAVPDRPDGVEHHAPLLVLVREQMQRADAEVEAVEHRVAGRTARRRG